MEQRRVLLAIVLAFAVVYVWQAFVVKPLPKPAQGNPPTAASTQAAPSPAPAPTPTAPAAAAPPEKEPAPAADALVGETAERDIRVETHDVIAVFTNRGARLKSWRLKHFFDA